MIVYHDLYVYIMCLYSILFQISQYSHWYTLDTQQQGFMQDNNFASHNFE